ncbi:MAG: hypothetical protein KGL53_11540, partial [Elusimicrobia bacterium]|nr:hypothetical protein [Elusimicrobiota bacterium]
METHTEPLAPGDLLLALLALAPFVVDYSGRLPDFSSLPQMVFMGAAAAAVGAVFAARASREGRTVELRWTPCHGAVVFFLVWCGLTGLWARSGWDWWQAWRHWLAAAAAGALAAAAGRRPAPWALGALFASACAQAFVCAAQYHGLAPFTAITQWLPPGGTFGHRSYAMEWLELGAP